MRRLLLSLQNFKIIAVIGLLFVYPSSANGQSAIATYFAQQVCQCYDSLEKKASTIENMSTCFSKELEANKVLLYHELIRVYGDTMTVHIKKLEEDLEWNTHLYMIDSSAAYFKFVDAGRFVKLKNLNKDSLRNLLNKVENIDVAKRPKRYDAYKGQLYFQLGSVDTSRTIIIKVLAEDSLNQTGLLTLAMIDESKKNYKEATMFYEKLAEITNKTVFLTYAAIARRKQRELTFK